MAEYIEREALREILVNWINAHADVDDAEGCGLLEDVLWELNAQPYADVVEVKRGRWENIVYNPVLRKMEATCSSCGCRGEIRTKGNCCGFVVPDSNFCPSCSADMREGDQ